MKNIAKFLTAMMAMVVIVVGCGKVGSSADTESKAFDAADPNTKMYWDKAMSAYKSNNYAGSIVLLQALRSQTNLTEKQFKITQDTLTLINTKMFEAFNRGDPNAQKAMEELKKIRGR